MRRRRWRSEGGIRPDRRFTTFEEVRNLEESDMKIHRRGNAVWHGGIRDGKGAISTESGALAGYPYGFASRFEGKPGTNPEELIAAAHAGCFTMALSLILGEAKFVAETMETSAH